MAKKVELTEDQAATLEARICNVVDLLVDFYPQFYKRLNGNEKYKFIHSEDRTEKLIKFATVVCSLVDDIGEDICKQYLSYAFGKYAGRKNHKGIENAFPMGWIISANLFREFLSTPGWIKASNDRKITAERKKFSKLGVKEIKSKFRKNEEWEERARLISNISILEENEKKRFYNSIKGFAWCIDNTTLINPNSEICLNCKFEKSCKETLKDNYPNYFKIRYNE